MRSAFEDSGHVPRRLGTSHNVILCPRRRTPPNPPLAPCPSRGWRAGIRQKRLVPRTFLRRLRGPRAAARVYETAAKRRFRACPNPLGSEGGQQGQTLTPERLRAFWRTPRGRVARLQAPFLQARAKNALFLWAPARIFGRERGFQRLRASRARRARALSLRFDARACTHARRAHVNDHPGTG